MTMRLVEGSDLRTLMTERGHARRPSLAVAHRPRCGRGSGRRARERPGAPRRQAWERPPRGRTSRPPRLSHRLRADEEDGIYRRGLDGDRSVRRDVRLRRPRADPARHQRCSVAGPRPALGRDLHILTRVGHHAGRFGLMDSLRAIAALSIVAYHVAPRAGAFDSELALDLSAQLSTGVALFFLISGFLLYRPFVVAHAEGERFPNVRRLRLAALPAHRARLLGGADRDRAADRPRGLRPPAALLRLRADLLAERRLRRHPGGLDAVHRGLLLRLPSALRPRRAPRGRARARLRVAGRDDGADRAVRASGSPGATAGTYADSELVHTSLNTLPAYLDWFAVGMGLAVVSAWLAGRRADAGRGAARGAGPRRGLGARRGGAGGQRVVLGAALLRPGAHRGLRRRRRARDRADLRVRVHPAGDLRRLRRRHGPPGAGLAGAALARDGLLRHLPVAGGGDRPGGRALAAGQRLHGAEPVVGAGRLRRLHRRRRAELVRPGAPRAVAAQAGAAPATPPPPPARRRRRPRASRPRCTSRRTDRRSRSAPGRGRSRPRASRGRTPVRPPPPGSPGGPAG